MRYRKLGNSGLEVSEICFGVMTFTGDKGWTHVGKIQQKEADILTNKAIDKGVNFFDTADIYSAGVSEAMLGKALGNKRKDIVIATKFGFKMSDAPNGNGLSRTRIMRACDESLMRLKTDYIDLYQVHSDDFATPVEETFGALNDLVSIGKVRYIGVSNYTAWRLVKSQMICTQNGWNKIVSLQAYYTILGRDLETELMPACLDQGIGIMIWGPLHGGILTGKYHKVKRWPKGTRILSDDFSRPHDINMENKVLDLLDRIAKNRNVTMAQVSLNYLLRKKGISSIVIGATSEKQLLENIEASEFILNDEEIRLIDDISNPNDYYPHWYFKTYRKNEYDKYYKV
ncbi:MAG: aldo/keto reductase [Melioribacteraceae bacterium]|nr:aldo/keto reductase [Melioribacteraceae bacterium]